MATSELGILPLAQPSYGRAAETSLETCHNSLWGRVASLKRTRSSRMSVMFVGRVGWVLCGY